jgi:hypothetical protein
MVPLYKEVHMLRKLTRFAVLAAAVVALAGASSTAHAVDARTQIYGFVMTDLRYDAEAKDPAWFDVMRPTKLPAVEDGFGESGNTSFSARQTRFGVKSFIPTDLGELRTTFEWELFGTGVDAGQTTLRLRHAYGELGHFGAGQTWSPFMDIDVFPNSVEYWGPPGMAFFRNVQARWMPIQGDTRMTIAIERPGASADQGDFAGRNELAGVVPRFPVPDVSAEYRLGQSWGYVELAGIVRRMEWDDLGPGPTDLSGGATGWGVNLSSNIKFSDSVLRLSALHGEGVENYMNDAPADIGIENQPGNPVAPNKGVALPVTGVVAFLDHTWNTKFTTAIGYSMVDIDNSAQQSANAFSKAQYALGNLLYSPTPGVTAGVEFQWGNRDNFSDGFTSDIRKVQFSFKYAFAKTY